MEQSAYAEMYELEDRHWWFRGRRALIWALLRRADVTVHPRLLDAGCGTGRNLVEFGPLGRASGVDPSPDAVSFCHQRGLDDVRVAGLEDLPFGDDEFDLLLACDVLEHIEDDTGAMRELRRVAAPGARLLITVPAYQWMWTEHDVQLHHVRRYTLAVLQERLRASGWTVTQATYFNSILLPVVAAARLTSRWSARWAAARSSRPSSRPSSHLSSPESSASATTRSSRQGHTDLDRTPALLNAVLELPMRLEAALVGRGARFPAGVSLGLVCRGPS
jgi:SAM-dependent methyltransferase